MNECLRLRLHVTNQMLLLIWPKLTTLDSAPSTQPIHLILVSRMRRKKRCCIFFPHYLILIPALDCFLIDCFFFGEVYFAKDFRIKEKWERLIRWRCTQAKCRRRWCFCFSWYSLHLFFLYNLFISMFVRIGLKKFHLWMFCMERFGEENWIQKKSFPGNISCHEKKFLRYDCC